MSKVTKSVPVQAALETRQPQATGQPATVLMLIRHAEVEARYQNVFGGCIDMELSPRGHQQAAALARYLQHRPTDAVYASPMIRVQQTLSPLLVNGMPKPIVRPELREVDFGVWTGLTWDEIQSKFGVSPFDWLKQLDSDKIPEAESAHKFRARVEPCVQDILERHGGKRVTVVCHGGVIRMFLSILLGLPLPKIAAFEIEYASLTQVVWLPHKVRLQLLNFTPWRDLRS